MSFQRTKFQAYVKLGSRQKSMRKYNKSRGRHNKIRQKEKSHPVKVEIGFRNKNSTRGLINEKKPLLIYNMKDLAKANPKEHIIIIGNIGLKNKINLAKEIRNRNLDVLNLNLNKFLKGIEKKPIGGNKK